MQVVLNQFDLNEIKKNPSMLFVGEQKNLKYKLYNDLLQKYDNDENNYNCVIISPYEKTFKGLFGEKYFVYNEYSDDIVRKILSYSENNNYNNKTFIIFDNCFNDSDIKNSELIELLYNARHYNIQYIMSIENPYIFPDTLMTNFDYVFIGSPNTNLNQNLEFVCAEYIDKYDCETFRNIYKNNNGLTMIDSKKKLYWL